MDLQVRPVDDEGFTAWVHASELSFGEVATEEDVERERGVAELDRTFGAFDGDRIVGTAAAYSLLMRVPGGAQVPAAGITMVGVLPTHRRLGLNTAMMRRLLDQAHQRGEPLAALFASEGGIYGRFGLGLASFHCGMDLETDRAAFVRGYRPSGRVRLLPLDEAVPAMLDVYDGVGRTRPGTVDVDERRLRYWLHDHGDAKELPFFFAVHEDEGDSPDAYAIYKVRHDWPGSVPMSELRVHDVQATTPQAYADIWRFLLDVDLVHRVTAHARPQDEPLLHLLAEPRRLRLTLKDALWVRLVDIPGALAARGYASEGRVVLEVEDRFCPWNAGRYALETGPGGAWCSPTEDVPDLACEVNALGATYLGGSTFRQLWRAGRVDERRPGALATADALFASDRAPWCPFVF